MRFRSGLCATFAVLTLVWNPASAEEVNLLGLGDGAMPVVEAPSYGSWPAVQMIDDASRTGWASQSGKLSNNVFVFELPVPGTPLRFEFHTVAVSRLSAAGFGQSKPVADNATELGRAQNRRVELVRR